jgi:hypothetical protein
LEHFIRAGSALEHLELQDVDWKWAKEGATIPPPVVDLSECTPRLRALTFHGYTMSYHSQDILSAGVIDLTEVRQLSLDVYPHATEPYLRLIQQTGHSLTSLTLNVSEKCKPGVLDPLR